MKKIYLREGGHPTFEQIRKDLIQKNGSNGGNAFQIVKFTCSSYKLQCRELKDISDIKQCLQQGRPLLAKFDQCDDQWFSQGHNQFGFKPFFQKYQKGILTDLPKRSNKPVGEHAGVLHKYTPEYYSLQTWGTNWGDTGFFKINNLKCLIICNLWKRSGLNKIEQNNKNNHLKKMQDKKLQSFIKMNLMLQVMNSIQSPKCQQKSFVNEYQGNYYEAKCPKCQQNFHSSSFGHLFVDYFYGKDT